MGGVVGQRENRKRGGKKTEALSLSRRNLGNICITRSDNYSRGKSTEAARREGKEGE